MGGLVESARREWYRLATARRLASNEWDRPYWRADADSTRIVACRSCPKFDARRAVCGVPFGSPLRKCVVASLESHLRGVHGLRTLELGFGRRSLAKHVVESAGGSWTGLEPGAEPHGAVEIGSGGYGHAANVPFADETFDLVFGIQSLEHWEEPHESIPGPSTYAACLQEVWRVLKPGGAIYFDAPIHLHGHEMFVLGDLKRIRALFETELWTDLAVERWRYEHEPLATYPTPDKEIARWPADLTQRMRARPTAEQARDTVWLVAITATKRRADPRAG